HPNGLQPGKRPRTTLVNYFASRDGKPVMTFGCPGGDAQAQANLQLILNVMVFGMNPQQAGLKATGPRVMLLSALEQDRSHPTAEQLYESLQIHHPSLSL
ncbi:hypothetical protein C2W62_53395, partial [Candidatus Entotheonella serta]